MVEDWVKQSRQAARDALQQTTQMVGVRSIPTATIKSALKNMTEDDLDMLAGQYGADQVVHLIRTALGG